jgi:DNA-directed RNA polymerase specialized sigma24 family protein
MSPHASELLLTQIVPRLRSAIPRSVRCVGSEDHEELVQDGTVIAAMILLSAHRRGKDVTAGKVAHFTLQHLKSGRRSVGFSRVDVLASGTQLTRRHQVCSFNDHDTEGEFEETMSVCEAISLDKDDPSTKAARNMDWQTFVNTKDDLTRLLLGYLVEGWNPREVASRLQLTMHAVRQRKTRLRTELLEFFGDSVLEEAARQPGWRKDLQASREKVACRVERQKENN